MNHMLMLPIVVPLISGGWLLFQHRLSLTAKRQISLASAVIGLCVALSLMAMAGDDSLRVYALGDWQAPIGITLLLDRLAALMLVTTAVLAALALLYACRGDDEAGPNFHALFQFQVMGLNGAFLTADLFNLFVFFEILLIASYALLVHGNTDSRIKAGMHYVLLNLVGSALFLIGISLLYGLLGSLNLADLAARIALVEPERAPLVAVAGFLLLVVFGLKAAILPVHFWLPSTYSAASGPVAALFAIMTKVGLYAIIRVMGLLFGSEAGPLVYLVQDWLWPMALLTLSIGVIGVLAARELKRLLAHLIVVSVGTMLAGIALGQAEGLAAALFYLVQGTWLAGALFLLADLIVRQRSQRGALQVAPAIKQPLLLGSLFFIGALGAVGLPPSPGFLAKLMLLQAVPESSRVLLWSVLLCGGFSLLVAFSRAGSQIFWHVLAEPVKAPSPLPAADVGRLTACILLLLCSVLVLVLAAPLSSYTKQTAQQLLNVVPYMRLIPGVTL